MANNLRLATASVNAALDAVTARLDGGTLRIYDGIQATDANTAVTDQQLLATLRFGSPAFSAATSGTAAAHAITSDPAIAATGTASWARLVAANGTSVVCDLSVGTADADVIFPSVSFQAGGECAVSSLTLTLPAHG
jgi:hypothetical protein